MCLICCIMYILTLTLSIQSTKVLLNKPLKMTHQTFSLSIVVVSLVVWPMQPNLIATTKETFNQKQLPFQLSDQIGNVQLYLTSHHGWSLWHCMVIVLLVPSLLPSWIFFSLLCLVLALLCFHIYARYITLNNKDNMSGHLALLYIFLMSQVHLWSSIYSAGTWSSLWRICKHSGIPGSFVY